MSAGCYPSDCSPGNPGAGADLSRLTDTAPIAKPLNTHTLCHTHATPLLHVGAERADIEALLGRVNLATMPIYTLVDQNRITTMVNTL